MAEIKVKKIKNGTVIDHIESGQALNVLRILGMTKGGTGTPVTVAMNVGSEKVGAKDIVKIEGRELKSAEVDRIALISPSATINIIRDQKVVDKKKVKIPGTIEGVLECTNPNCITHFERIRTRFLVEGKKPLKLRCAYCERITGESEVIRQF